MLKINSNMTREQLALALDSALLLGLGAESAVFPVAGSEGDIPLPQNKEELLCLWKGSSTPQQQPLPSRSEGLFTLDCRAKKGLEGLFCTGEFLKDTNNDFMVDEIDVKLVLPQNADASLAISACNIAFRLGMESCGAAGNILAEEGCCGNAIVFTAQGSPSITMEKAGGNTLVYINGSGKPLEQFTSALCNKFPYTTGFHSWSDVLLHLTRGFAMKNADGQLAYLKAAAEENPHQKLQAYLCPTVTPKQKDAFSNVEFFNHKGEKEVVKQEFDLPWETDILKDVLEKQIYPLVKQGDTVQIFAAVSEGRKVRNALCGEIESRIASLGGNASVQLLNAYKQGFCWLREKVIPDLKKSPETVDRIEIYFKPFLPQGQSEWLDENGATPNRTRGLENTPDKWFDLPIRYLQEIYPIEDILHAQLGINRENIRFIPYEGEENITYLCKAFNGTDSLYEAELLARCSERPYMDSFPQLGKVHPSTGYLKAVINGKTVYDQNLATDIERVWDIYQQQVLPLCAEYINEKSGGVPLAENQPFFSTLHLDITLSEEEERLDSREDIISPLSALHEDLYFTGSDFFKYYGQQKGAVIDAPGLILPDLHIKEGKPKFVFTLTEPLRHTADICCSGKSLCRPHKEEDIHLYISSVAFKNSGLSLSVRCEGVKDSLVKALAQLWDRGILTCAQATGGFDEIEFVTDQGNRYTARCTALPPKEKKTDIRNIDLCEDRVISYEMYMGIMEQLKEVEGIEVFPVAQSYMGRTVYAVWFKPQHRGYLSFTKLCTNRPTIMINSRHHANEVSSTNSAFMLIKQLLCDEKYQDLAHRLNLVIVPMENPDGAAIHYSLQKEHPNWQLHVARFNALGREFAGDYFKADPLSREALATGRLYQKFVPDIMVDNHGVPSHEWDQQFSGYTSPAYKGFWLPRSLLYGYYWYAKEEEYTPNLAVSRRMEQVIADIIAQDREMTALNREWAAQFEKYAHAWLPKLFPAEYYGDMINYWIPFETSPRNTYTSVRWPWLTCVGYTSEVADETAQGEYLNLCARAHLKHDIATIDMLLNSHSSYLCGIQQQGNSWQAQYLRIRPLCVD